MSKRLFDLSDEILSLEEQLDNEELTDEERQALVDQWLEAQGDVEQKLDNYAAFIESLETYAEQRTYQAERLRRLAQADEDRAKRLREALKIYFRRHELTKFKTPRFTIALQKNGGKAPLIVPPSWDQEPELAPELFRRVVTQLDREAIRRAVEDFYKQAEFVTSKAESDQERRRLFSEWIERDELARKQKELIEGCEMAQRGESIRIR
jgi:Gp157 protein